MDALNLGQNYVVNLKGCPYCGSGATFTTTNEFELYWVHCDECGAVGPGDTTHEKAIAAWNRRHDETPSEFERLCGKENSHV
ncbi:Lar family restriction alleviation protein [Sinorhizobium meliloti]|uniref:Lar family restriction alleviation protein n=1 Tax=Rhizobium meliloti TaxID=382 RepID=UPI00299DF793|nr:restriction alleviation protein, Lar family [Sinorhizobium meliloti]